MRKNKESQQRGILSFAFWIHAFDLDVRACV